MSRKGEKVKELIMIVDGAATLKFVYLEGDMTLKDIQNIMMYQNTSWNGNNVNIQLPDINWAEIEVEEPRLAWRIEAFARTGIERAGKCS